MDEAVGAVGGSEAGGGRARGLLRRRRANVAGGRQHRHEVKVTPEEEAQLMALAALHGVTVPRLLVESALSRDQGETPTQRRDSVAELFRAIRLLSAISNNVNQIARATNATGEVHTELSATLAAVRRTAERVDSAIEEIAT